MLEQITITYHVTTVYSSLSLPPYLQDVATVKIDDSSIYNDIFVTVPKSWASVLELYLNNSSEVVKYQLYDFKRPNAYLLCYHPDNPGELFYITYLGDTLSDYTKRVIFYIHTCGYKFITQPIFMQAANFQNPFNVPVNVKNTLLDSQTLPPPFFLY